MDAEPGDPSELVSLFVMAILRRWRFVLLVAVTMVLVVYGALQMIGDVYTPRANLLAKIGRENVEVPGATSSGNLVSTGVRKEDVNSDVSLLGSRALIERSIDALGIEAFQRQQPLAQSITQMIRQAISRFVQSLLRMFEETLIVLRLAREQTPREKIINRIETALMVRREGESDVISVILRTPDPDLGARFLEMHVEQFMTQRSVARRSSGITRFFDDRVTDDKVRLDQLDMDIMQLRSQLSLASVEVERGNLLRRSAELDSAIAAAASSSAITETLARFVPADGDTAQSGAGASPAAVRARIADLIIERATLLERFATNAQPMQEIEGRIGQLTALLERSAAKEIATLTAERRSIDLRLETLNGGELKLDRMNLERSLARERYGEHRKQRDVALIGAELEQRRVANISVLTPPTRPSLPDSPRRVMIMLVSLPLGLLLGLALAALFTFLDPRVLTLNDFTRASGIPALGTFSPGSQAGGKKRAA
ncbi:hypothetical protein IP69_18425 [Bosea sp. AAP35]|uniref:hypothetical protein n=1 Tax=Bosea sp. AAP35 TaxID=1523417 RepID=UPI0006B8B47B|nr:hypothetical protein [Bosea sp. AAP35]KPF64296.1 hypothetical protein IP69_18425 [Bosea sp. AAP35]